MILFATTHAPLDTTGYYIAGYAIFFTVMALYIASMFIRSRNLRQEYELLVELDQDE